MMKLHEFQSKQILAPYGVEAPQGAVAIAAEEAGQVALRLGGSRFAVKAQIHAGGRGRAGGVPIVSSPDAAEEAARALLGRRLVTEQSGAHGRVVERVLVEAAVDHISSFYLSLSVHAASGTLVLAASGAGGDDIEDRVLAGEGGLERLSLGDGSQARREDLQALAARLGLAGQPADAFAALADGLRRAFLELDASLIEINPLVLTADDRLLALDVKMIIDDHALFRQASLAELREEDGDEYEVKARQRQLNYVRMEGAVGIAANGAGLGLATVDLVHAAGGAPANFMDIRTTATSLDIAHGFGLLLDNPQVRALLINVHGGGMQSCDTVAEGLGIAMRRAGRTLPVVTRLAGNNADYARSRFANFGCRIIECPDMWTAAAKAVAAAR
ncbi:ATP-grasp domain-containing protein [Labrys neptuniae]|nr:ATP-grasp domain-containing protein [Labrys neptuniae]